MFSPAKAKLLGGSGRGRDARLQASAATAAGGGGGGRGGGALPPATPPAPVRPSPDRTAAGYGAALPSTPSTPWAAQHSRGGAASLKAPDGSQPALVCDFPRQVRSHAERQLGVRGGMDGRLGLSWLLQAERVFVWSHLGGQAPSDCAVLTLPAELGFSDKHADQWLVCLVEQEQEHGMRQQQMGGSRRVVPSVSVLLCNQKTLAVAYWPQAFRDGYCPQVVVASAAEQSGDTEPSAPSSARRPAASWTGGAGSREHNLVKGLAASAVPGAGGRSCVAIAGRAGGELYRLNCSPHEVTRQRIVRSVDEMTRAGLGIISLNSSSMRCLAWRTPDVVAGEGSRQLLLLTAKGVECWDVELAGAGIVTLAWSHDFIVDNAGSDKVRDSVHKEFAGQKQVWLLDLQVDQAGKEFTVLVASYLKDRNNNSNYMQYSLLTFLLHGTWGSGSHGEVAPVEKKAAMQVILPKARVEEEDFLYSMRLRTGGKPAGSAVILAGDGTATVAHSARNGSLRLYQFDVAWDVGKVLDASVVPPLEDGDEGSWLVLTEKAGVWVIPEKVVLLGGVEPPQKNLSRRGSSNEETANEERRKQTFGSIALRRVSSESAPVADNRDLKLLTVVAQRPVRDEETEEIVAQLLQQFTSSGVVDNALAKLQRAKAFDREGDVNVFARTSKAIVDTLGKHWTRGGDAGTCVVSSQFAEKQRQHQQYLNFLVSSGCHQELQRMQREALQTILEHGEKLAAMMKLRELHNSRAQGRHPFSAAEGKDMYSQPQAGGELVGALWDTVQLVGEKLRRTYAVLMNREKAEVFYSRVSDLEEFFACIDHHGESIIGLEYPSRQRAQRLCELADACTMSLRAAIQYRDSQQLWYPPPEGLTPWYCNATIRSGLWKLAALAMELKSEISTSHPEVTQLLATRLEEVSDMMLEGYSGAMKAKLERGEEHRGLQNEYGMKRDVVLSALHQQAKEMTASEDNKHQRSVVLDEIYPSLMALAQRHAGYQTLLDICSDLNDNDQLRSLMRETIGSKEGSFCFFVFQKYYAKEQYARLLILGEEFQEELKFFLHEHRDLAWLHDLFLERLGSASSILHSLALSNTRVCPLGEDAMHDSPDETSESWNLEDRMHLLYLAKLSALADSTGGREAEEKLARLDADIGILHVQARAVEAGIVGDEVLSARQLIEACLKQKCKELVTSVFDVFALAGETFTRGNKSLLESAWVWAADQDDWAIMRQVSEDEGWSDEHHLQFLQSTALCLAAARCYGDTAAGSVQGTFEETLPLLQSEDGAGLSVELVLMRHPDFSFAGQAMHTALRLGIQITE